MAARAKTNAGLGPLYVALGKGSTTAEPGYLLVKLSEASSYLPAWHSEAEAKRYIDNNVPRGEAVPTLLTRAGLDRTKELCAKLGHQLFLKVGDV
jgi:hypothetical protein